jgi:hypothetical protein
LPLGHKQNTLLSVSAGGGGPGFSFMREIIFGQQPPKQPLAQNKNGSQFGCLVSC